jgi:Kef-type K+ transport system membrane component KefB
VGIGEALIIAFILTAVGVPLVGSIVGMKRAARRREQGRHSVGAIVLASIACLVALATVPRSAWFISVPACVLSCAWLVAAIAANRAARGIARRQNPSE